MKGSIWPLLEHPVKGLEHPVNFFFDVDGLFGHFWDLNEILEAGDELGRPETAFFHEPHVLEAYVFDLGEILGRLLLQSRIHTHR